MVAAIMDRVAPHSNTDSESISTGTPCSPMLQAVQPNRSSTRVEKVIEAGCCSV